MFQAIKNRVETAIQELQKGKSVILLDNEDRENEGDLIIPGQTATEENINLMLQYASGIVCLAMFPEHAKKLKLSSMVPVHHNTSQFITNFTTSIEAKTGVTTGVSAKDRTRTIKVASDSNVKYTDISRPGHIFPLIANPHGVLGRQGHTEGSVDLAKMAGFYPVAVLCELMNTDGSMMKGEAIKFFAKKFDLCTLTIEDIRLYRLFNEQIIRKEVVTFIPFKKHGKLSMTVFSDPVFNKEIMVISKDINSNPLVRIHSSCVTGDLFGSLKCDCQSQLHHALDCIAKEGGILIYLSQEGRGIGLINKLKAYELQRTKKLDTIEANKALDLPIDDRCYDAAIQVLKYYGIVQCKLLSNNPKKVQALEKANIIVEVLASESVVNHWNKEYLKTKNKRFHHNIKGV